MKEQLNVLLVEDEPGDAFLITEYLSESNDIEFHVTLVPNLQKAVEELKTNSYHIVLLDLGLPDSTGLSSLEILDKANSKVPILVITGLDKEETGRLSINLGAQGYIVKSKLDSQVLVNTILYSIERHQHLLKIKENELELETKNEQLREVNEAKDRLFSIIAHDLKSPFNSILGLIEILHIDYDIYTEAEKKNYISAILSSAQSTYTLLENLLLWSRTQSGQLGHKPKKIPLDETVQKSIVSFNQIAENKKIKLIREIPQGIWILYDRDMFNTILRNLISNAIKFSPRKSNVIIGVKNYENNEMALFVKDEGVGIDEKQIPALLSGAGNHTTKGTEKEKGTGLGLTICVDFVKKHKGSIWVESEKGNGTTFYFSLPMIDNVTSNKKL